MRSAVALGIVCSLGATHLYVAIASASLHSFSNTAQRVAADDTDRLKVILRRVAEYIDTFWIEADSGRICESELFVNTALRPRVVVSARIHVVYAEEPHLRVWLPVSMNETYEGLGVIDGHATYSNFRRFSVATTESIKKP